MPPMRHAFRPSTERLEAHVLLSSATSATMAVSGSPIVETLTTDKTVYKVGQPIQITLTETNTTNAPVVSQNVTHGRGFTVSRNFKDVWKSNGGRRAAPSVHITTGPDPHHHRHLERSHERRLDFTFEHH